MENFVCALMDQHCAFNRLIGLTMVSAEGGQAQCRISYRPELMGDESVPAIHGGVISALADTAGGAALWSTVGSTARVATVDLRVDYLAPAGRADLLAEAFVSHRTQSLGFVDVSVTSAGAEVARARAVYCIRRPSEGGLQSGET